MDERWEKRREEKKEKKERRKEAEKEKEKEKKALVSSERWAQDGASIMREHVARGKAWGSLGLGVPSRAVAESFDSRPGFFNSAFAASDGRVIASPGGVLVLDSGGRIIGAVGVSGDVGDQDEAAAIVGIHAAGLQANPSKRSSKL